jgi:putative ABC transport system permease protein
MEIRPIVSALMRHKTGTLLVATQIAVSLAIIVNALFIINQRVEKISRPTGMDTGNIIAVSVRGFGEQFDVASSVEQDMAMLRGLPDVLAATVINQIPLSGSGGSTSLRSVPDDTVPATPTITYVFDHHGLDTLGVELIAGRNFHPEEVERKSEDQTPAPVIITKALADKLYPDGSALGKPVYWWNLRGSTVIGIIGHMQGAWVGSSYLNQITVLPGIPANETSRYMIRVEPGERDRMLAVIEERLVDMNTSRAIKRIRTFDEIIARSYEIDRTMANVLIVVIALLVGLTALVIAGLASFFVSQRIKQIGTRRALGATQVDILRYFLVENWIITSLGAVVGCLLTVGVSYWLETNFSLPRLDLTYLLVCVLVLWIVSQLAALFPAIRAATVLPVVATRTV